MLRTDFSSRTPTDQNDGNTSTTTITLPPVGSEADPIIDPNCLTNDDYNACIFFKNPQFHNADNPFNPATNYSTDLTEHQVYAVNLKGLTNNKLQNSNFRVTSLQTGIEEAKPNPDGTWKFDYANDSNHKVAQVMTYYWIFEQIQWMKENVGTWYPENKNILADSYNESVQNNAYFSSSDNMIRLGVFTRSGPGGRSEAALSAEVTVHEMGHANWYYGNRTRNNFANTVVCPESNNTPCCPDDRGCVSAANEGQADVHAFFLFGESPSIGNFIDNNVGGLETNCGGLVVSRNPEVNFNLTTAAITNNCPFREIHWYGSVYAAIWWEIYKDPTSDKIEVAKLFNETIPVIGPQDTFEEMAGRILNLDAQFFAGKYSSKFDTEFRRRGLIPIF